MNRYYKSVASGEVFSLPASMDDGPPNGCVAVVVISPEDRDQVERIATTLGNSGAFTGFVRGNADALQAALRSLIAPPKPDEPTGLGAVVEDASGDKWVRSQWDMHHPWSRAEVGELNADSAVGCDFHEIAAVEILSEGVQP